MTASVPAILPRDTMRGKATKYKTQYLSDHDEKVRILTFLLRRKSIRLVSVSYQSRMVPVSSFVLPSFLLLSLFYHSRFQKRKQYGKNTETIRKPCGIDTETIGGTKKEQRRNKVGGRKKRGSGEGEGTVRALTFLHLARHRVAQKALHRNGRNRTEQAIQTGSTHPFSDGGVTLCALRSYLPIGLISTESIFSNRKVCSTQQRK